MKKYSYLFLSIMVNFHLGAHDIKLMPGYHNSLAGVDVYQSDNGAMVEFSFTGADPVCTYIPRSCSESNNPQMRRYYIPLSEIDTVAVDKMLQRAQELCENMNLEVKLAISDAPCDGLECLFTGALDIKKRIDADNKTVLFELARRSE